ncbi:hypothetical protein ILYODFUR_019881 [Ilyodon furcidens]|uniref:Uncharacterized protein n=1 Tax=Ilyodon furcidens TaxID=33524 RepID=A0ABV0TLK7_9TELE
MDEFQLQMETSPPKCSSFSFSTPPISFTPLFHTTVDSGDISSTVGGISFLSTACTPTSLLWKNSCFTHTEHLTQKWAHIPRQYPQHWNNLVPQAGMLTSSPGFHQA